MFSALARIWHELRTCFTCKRGPIIVLSADRIRKSNSRTFRELNIGLFQVDFRPNRQLLFCFNCWRYGHARKVFAVCLTAEDVDSKTTQLRIAPASLCANIAALGTERDWKAKNFQPITRKDQRSVMSRYWSLSE